MTPVPGTEEEHIQYCFDIYDLNNDGFITREEMLNMLKTALGRQGLEEDQDEGVKVGLRWNIGTFQGRHVPYCFRT